MPGPLIPLSGTTSGLELVINGVYVTHEPAAAWPSSRLRENKFSHIIYVDRRRPGGDNCTDDENTSAGVDGHLDPNEFECLELNFNSALVLPNLYKSDKFIAKALQNDGKVMIIEPNSSCQKCIAIILGYFMCNFELSFWHAYETLRKLYRPKFELDRFLIMQLYEYEPILKVRRAAEEMGHSFQSQRLRSVLKRSSCALDSSYEEQARGEEVNDDEREEETTRLPQGRSLALPGEETMVE